MFKFNFNAENDDEEKCGKIENIVHGDAEKCIEHFIDKDKVGDENEALEILDIKHVNCAEIVAKMKDKPEYLSDNVHSDLIKNVYEGGMKIWECSIDLVKYLSQNQNNLSFSKVLEIGCGAALPGLQCLKSQKVQELHLQDFNHEVIEHITKPNVVLNLKENDVKIRLFSGDWSDFSAKIKDQEYDLILTSETIYQEENYGKLLAIFDQLSSTNPNARILLAAKIHYFGVGGGLRTFEKTLNSNQWTFETVFENCDSVNREIIEIKRKF